MMRFLIFLELLSRAFRNARQFAKWIWRVLVAVGSDLGALFLTFWSRVPEVCSSVAEEWTRRAVDGDFPSIWDDVLYRIFWVLSFLMVVGAWIFYSWLTLTILRLIF